MSFEARITYRNLQGKKFDEVTTVDIDSGRGSLQTTVYGIHDAAKALRSVDKKLDTVNRHLKNPIQVTTEDLQVHEQRIGLEREEMMRQHRELQAQLLPKRPSGPKGGRLLLTRHTRLQRGAAPEAPRIHSRPALTCGFAA